MKINIIGDIWQPTGYGIHTLELLKALDEIGEDVSLESLNTPPNWENLVTNKIREMILKDNRNGINIMISLPYQWMLKKGERTKFVGFGIFEGSKVHTSWRQICNQNFINQIWVPSQHTRNAFVNGGVTKQINIVPHGVDLKIFNENVKADENLKSDKFTFLYMGGWAQGPNDRRAIDILLRAFTEEFKREENVRLILKLNPVYGQNQTTFAQMIESLRLKPMNERAEIQILTNIISYQQLPTIYKTADVFIMPTKAEAFSLTCLESMACGVPVITTNYGGQTEYINNENGWLIQMERMTKATDMNIFYEEADWAIPHQIYLQKLMRSCYTNEDLVKEKGKEAVKNAGRYSWKQSATIARDYMSEL